MKLIDSNILIYASKPEYPELKTLIQRDDVAVSNISRLEVLSWAKLTSAEIEFFNAVFSVILTIAIDDDVIDKAIVIRKSKAMKLGDAIIGATALLNAFELVTRNVDDFKHLPSLLIINPIDK